LKKELFEIKPASLEVHAGKSLQLAMAINDVSASDVAKHLDVTRQTVHKLLDTRKMSNERLIELASFFSMSVEDFLELPHHPLGSAFDHFIGQLFGHFQQLKPQQLRYLRNHDDAIRQISRTIRMLEQG